MRGIKTCGADRREATPAWAAVGNTRREMALFSRTSVSVARRDEPGVEAMSAAAKTSPAHKLRNEVRDSQTGLVLGWVDGDRALQEALTRHGFRLRPAVRRRQRLSDVVAAR